MLRPIDRLSERIGVNALTRMHRLRQEADELERQQRAAGVSEYFFEGVYDRREHADLIEEIHRLSNPAFDRGDG